MRLLRILWLILFLGDCSHGDIGKSDWGRGMGRVILHNYVLIVIPILCLSFLNMSVKVWKKIVKIYIRFLCVWWKEILRFFGSSGLMSIIPSEEVVYEFRISAWLTWPCWINGGGGWSRIRLDFGRISNLLDMRYTLLLSYFRYASTWWRKVSLLDSKAGDSFDYFVESLRKKTETYLLSSFWEHIYF